MRYFKKADFNQLKEMAGRTPRDKLRKAGILQKTP